MLHSWYKVASKHLLITFHSCYTIMKLFQDRLEDICKYHGLRLLILLRIKYILNKKICEIEMIRETLCRDRISSIERIIIRKKNINKIKKNRQFAFRTWNDLEICSASVRANSKRGMREKFTCLALRPKRDVLTKQQSLSLSDIQEGGGGRRNAICDAKFADKHARATSRIVEIQKYVARKRDASMIDY